MARPRGLIKVVCQNDSCSHFRKDKDKDIIKRGKSKSRHQRFFCFHCNTYFVETKGTPLYKRKLKENKIKSICKDFVETGSIRATERKAHVHRDTVMNLMDSLGEHALEMSNYLVHDLGLKTYEVDELFAVVKKNRKGLSKKSIISLDKARLLLQHA